MPSFRPKTGETPVRTAKIRLDVLRGFEMYSPCMKVSDIQGQVDFAIITMRDDELSAVLKRFPADCIVEGEREYNISLVPYSDSEQYLVAVARCLQGNNQSQAIANDIISDLDPQWLVLVGIAGAVPEDEFTLGDVIIARKLTDFTVGAFTYPNRQEWAVSGGWMVESVGRIVDNLLGRRELEGWNTEESIATNRPPVDLEKQKFIGSEDWKEKVEEKLKHHFGPGSQPRPPKFTTATIASSGDLIKDPNLIEQWLNTARDLKAVEMELPGVYTAARKRDKEYPVLAIRGISDIVGFKRDPGWTKYACESAAAFTNAFIKQRRPFTPQEKKGLVKELVSEWKFFHGGLIPENSPRKDLLPFQVDRVVRREAPRGDVNHFSFDIYVSFNPKLMLDIETVELSSKDLETDTTILWVSSPRSSIELPWSVRFDNAKTEIVLQAFDKNGKSLHVIEFLPERFLLLKEFSLFKVSQVPFVEARGGTSFDVKLCVSSDELRKVEVSAKNAKEETIIQPIPVRVIKDEIVSTWVPGTASELIFKVWNYQKPLFEVRYSILRLEVAKPS